MNKGHVAPPPSPISAELWGSAEALRMLNEAQPGLKQLFVRLAGSLHAAAGPRAEDEAREDEVYRLVSSVRKVLILLTQMGLLKDSQAGASAARALCSDYLQRNLFSNLSRCGGRRRGSRCESASEPF